MPLSETNPAHIYRACLRECSYLPLPQCRSYMREFTVEKFRNFIPKQSPGSRRKAPDLSPEKTSRLLKLARKYASILKHANQGYSVSLEKVLRMSYGRVGHRKYELLAKFLYPNTEALSDKIRNLLIDSRDEHDGVAISPARSEDGDELEQVLDDKELEESTDKDTFYPSLSPTVSTTTFTTFYTPTKKSKPPPVESNPPKWKLDLPPRLHALLTSQSIEQPHFYRSGSSPRVKLKFNPPAQTIWGKPLPFSRYKNQRTKWYNQNMTAAIPPLATEAEYWQLHDLVTGKREMPALISRRAAAEKSTEDKLREHLEKQSELILEGPKFGPRLKDLSMGRPHEITPRLLQRLLSRVVLSQTPLVTAAAPETRIEADSGLAFYWDDGLSRGRFSRATEQIQKPVPESQAGLLFA